MKYLYLLLVILTIIGCNQEAEVEAFSEEQVVEINMNPDSLSRLLENKSIAIGIDKLSYIVSHYDKVDSIYLKAKLLHAKIVFYNGQWKKSSKLFRETEDLYLREYGQEHPDLVDLYNWWGQVYFKMDYCDSVKLTLLEAQKLINKNPNKYNPIITAEYHKNFAQYYSCIEDYEKMKAAHHLAYEVLYKAREKYPNEAAWQLVQLASSYISTKEYWSAIEYNNKALEVLKEAYGHQPTEGFTSTVYNNLGYCYNAVGKYDLAIANLRRAIDKNLSFATLEDCHPGVASNFKNIAFASESVGDLKRAKLQFEIALKILQNEKHKEANTVRAAQIRIGLIRVLYKLKDFEGADQLISEAFSIERQEGRENSIVTTAVLYEWLGKIKLAQEKFHEAESAFAKSGTIFNGGAGGSQFLNFDHQLEVGIAYLNAKRYQEALDIFLKLESSVHSTSYSRKPDLGLQISKCYFGLKDYERFEKWMGYTTRISGYRVDDPDRFQKQYNLDFLLNYLTLNSEWHELNYNNSKRKRALETAIFYLEDANNYLFQHRQRLHNSTFVEKTFSPYQEKLLELYEKSEKPNKQEQIFRIFEQSRAVQLLRATRASKSRNYPNVPTSISANLDDLFAKINYYNNRLQIDAKENNVFQGKLEATFRELDQRKKMVQESYPDYYEYRFGHKTISIKEVQNRLRKDQIVLEFYWGEKELRAICISKNGSIVKKLGETAAIKSEIRLFLNGLVQSKKDLDNSTQHLHDYINNGVKLNERLIKPFSEWMRDHGGHLIVVPDGSINDIPFSALLTSSPDDVQKYYEYPYLLHKFKITTGFSSTLHLDLPSEKTTKKNSNYIGFAPFSTKGSKIIEDQSVMERSEYGKLKFSSREIKEGKEFFKGKIFLAAEASKPAFLKEAPGAGILHCATHAIGNKDHGELSHLLFTINKDPEICERLYAQEIYNLDLNAEMVILSTCQSSKGEYLEGEGMVSLAYAFGTAGAKSVCATYWNLNDQASYEILSLFFKYLKNGMEKNEALQQAQIQFIAEQPHKSHPHYWAVFHLYGNTDQLSSDLLRK